MSEIPASHINFLHLLLKEVAREALHGRILAIRTQCSPEIEQRFAVIERNVDALRGLLPPVGADTDESVSAWGDDIPSDGASHNGLGPSIVFLES